MTTSFKELKKELFGYVVFHFDLDNICKTSKRTYVQCHKAFHVC